MEKAPKMVKRETVEEETQQGILKRSVVRSLYLVIKNDIFDKKDDIMSAKSDKFNTILNEVETLHQHVQRPREQVADAAALLDLTNTLVTFSKSHANGVTPSDFVTSLLRNFGPKNVWGNVCNVVSWADIGFAVSPLFQTAGGCSTMMGPMKTEMKKRASVVRRIMTWPTETTRFASNLAWMGPMNTEMKHRASVGHRRMTRATKIARPEEEELLDTLPVINHRHGGGYVLLVECQEILHDKTSDASHIAALFLREVATAEEEGSGTDKNMQTMFDILRKKRSARLESLVLNRRSFAQTIENIFALSFLVKDGRAEITTTDSGHHLVSPRNAPSASAISSGEVRYHHYVFRFDFEDWKLMAEAVGVGEELMPHRCRANRTATDYSQPRTAPARNLCRNRGLIVQEKVACGDHAGSPKQWKRRISFD